jgi:hypothetical protein
VSVSGTASESKVLHKHSFNTGKDKLYIFMEKIKLLPILGVSIENMVFVAPTGKN